MNTEQFDALNTWMAVLACAAVVQIGAMILVAALGYRVYVRARVALVEMERRRVEPVTQRLTVVIDAVTAEVARVRRAGDAVERTASSVRDALVPGYAIVRGVLAAVAALHAGGRAAREPLTNEDVRDCASSRMVNEGGNDARTSDE